MNYFKNKKSNVEKAVSHYNYLKDHHSDLIESEVVLTKIYDENSTFTKRPKTRQTEIVLEDKTTLEDIYDVTFDEPLLKVGVLNFASFKNPGGLYLQGSYAQEEYLCHHTTLYNILSHNKFSEFYRDNRSNLNKGLYYNRAIYSDKVTIDSKEYYCPTSISILTCASPNKSYLLRGGQVSVEENTEALRSRIKFVLDIFAENNNDILILGAFGCGVFKQDAKDVASIFVELLDEYDFKKVIFRIPDKNSYNYKKFEEVLNYGKY